MRSIEYQGHYEGYTQHPEVIKKAAITVAVNTKDADECIEFLEMLGLIEPIKIAPSLPPSKTVYKTSEEERAAKAEAQRLRRARRRAEGKRPS